MIIDAMLKNTDCYVHFHEMNVYNGYLSHRYSDGVIRWYIFDLKNLCSIFRILFTKIKAIYD
jgi:hypothetical protein